MTQHRRKKAAVWLGTLHTSLLIGLLLRSHSSPPSASHFPRPRVESTSSPLLLVDSLDWSTPGVGHVGPWGTTLAMECSWASHKPLLDPISCLFDQLSVLRRCHRTHQPPHTVQAYQLSEPESPRGASAGAPVGSVAVDWWPYTSSRLWRMLDSDQLAMMTSPSSADLEPISCRQQLLQQQYSSVPATATGFSGERREALDQRRRQTDEAWELIDNSAMTYSASEDGVSAISSHSNQFTIVDKSDASESTLAISSHGDSEPLPGNSESLLSMQRGGASVWNVTSVLRNDVTISRDDRPESQLTPSCLTDVSDVCDDRPVASGMWPSEESSTPPVFSSMSYLSDSDHEEGEKDSGRGCSDSDEEDAAILTLSSESWSLDSREVAPVECDESELSNPTSFEFDRTRRFSSGNHEFKGAECFSSRSQDSEGEEGVSPRSQDGDAEGLSPRGQYSEGEEGFGPISQYEEAEGFSVIDYDSEGAEGSSPRSQDSEGAEGFSPRSQDEGAEGFSLIDYDSEGAEGFSPRSQGSYFTGYWSARGGDPGGAEGFDSCDEKVLSAELGFWHHSECSFSDRAEESFDTDSFQDRLSKTGDYRLSMDDHWRHSAGSVLSSGVDWENHSDLSLHSTYSSQPLYYTHQTHHHDTHYQHDHYQRHYQSQAGSSHSMLALDVYAREETPSSVIHPSTFPADTASGHYPAQPYLLHQSGNQEVIEEGEGGMIAGGHEYPSASIIGHTCRSAQQTAVETGYSWTEGARQMAAPARIDGSNIISTPIIDYPVSVYSSLEPLETQNVSSNQPADPSNAETAVSEISDSQDPPGGQPPAIWNDHGCVTSAHHHQQQQQNQGYMSASSASCSSRSAAVPGVFTETAERLPALSPGRHPAPALPGEVASASVLRQSVTGATHHSVITHSGSGHLPCSPSFALVHNHTYTVQSVCREDVSEARAVCHTAVNADFNKRMEVFPGSCVRPPPPPGRLQQRQSLSRDERRARSMSLPLSNTDIISLPMDEFNERLSRFALTDAQLCLIRDIRRRGKNKLAAQNCRRRKLDQIVELADEVERVREMRRQTLADHQSLCRQRALARHKYNTLYWHVFKSLRSHSGECYSPDQYSLYVSDSDSSVVLVSHNNNNNKSESESGAALLSQCSSNLALLSQNCTQPDVLASSVSGHDS